MKYKNLTLKYALVNASFMFMVCATVGYAYNFLSQSGIADGTVGILITAVSLCGLIGQTLSGSIIDKSETIDEKKFISMSLIAVMALGVVLALVPAGSVLMMIVSVICFTFASIGMPFLNSMAFIYEKDGQTINYGLCRGIGSAAWAVGSSLIGQLWSIMGRTILPWYVVAFAALSFVLVNLMPTPSAEAEAAAAASDATKEAPKDLSYGAFFSKYGKAMIVAVAMILMYFCHMMIQTYMAKVIGNIMGDAANATGAVESVQGNALFIAAIVELPTMFLFSKIIEKISIHKVMIFASIIWSVKHVLTWLCPNVIVLYMIMVLQMLSYAALVPALVYFANESVEAQDRNKSQAIFAATATVGTLLASLIGGQLFQFMSVSAVLFIAVIASCAGTVLMFIGIKAVESK
ncbi:MAG: MFS transporter [Solobacterium sp.]|nr:MFS transporter [Solobacterium sp.]MBQ9824137.1 MFS transporter [Solobacterium sp.]